MVRFIFLVGLYYTETEVRQISEVTRRDIAKLFIDGPLLVHDLPIAPKRNL